MTPTELEAAYPELFEAARFFRSRARDPSEVRLRCIIGADGEVIAGKPPPPDPEHWVHVERDGKPAPAEPPPPRTYRGRR